MFGLPCTDEQSGLNLVPHATTPYPLPQPIPSDPFPPGSLAQDIKACGTQQDAFRGNNTVLNRIDHLATSMTGAGSGVQLLAFIENWILLRLKTWRS